VLNTEVARILEKTLGLGEFPMVRRRLYGRLQRVCQQRGDVPLTTVAQVLEEAKSLRDRKTGGPATADSKGRWFSKAVVARLSEAGYWERDQGGEGKPPAERQREQLDTLRSQIGKPVNHPEAF